MVHSDGSLTVENLRILRAQQLAAHMPHNTDEMPLAHEEGMTVVRPLEHRQQRRLRLATIACGLLWVGVIFYAAFTATPAPPHPGHHRDASGKMAAIMAAAAEQQRQRQQEQQEEEQQQLGGGQAARNGSSAAGLMASAALPVPSPPRTRRSLGHSPESTSMRA